MNTLKRIFSEWFGHSRRERRASVILVIIITIVLLIRYLIPEKGIDIEVTTILPPSQKVEYPESLITEDDTALLFEFDPNTASFGELTSLGFPLKVAVTLIRFRSSGGTFRKPHDIFKVYGMDSSLAYRLIPFVRIEPSFPEGRRPDTAGMVSTEKREFVLRQVDINRCDSADLEVLPGIGPVLSVRIIKYRELLGGYISVAQLKEVYGIPDTVYQLISGLIIIDTSAVKRININSAGLRELERHPYIERYDAQAIIKYRDYNGKIEGLNELRENRILTSEKIALIGPYIGFI